MIAIMKGSNLTHRLLQLRATEANLKSEDHKDKSGQYKLGYDHHIGCFRQHKKVEAEGTGAHKVAYQESHFEDFIVPERLVFLI